jgi:hypothetical protein
MKNVESQGGNEAPPFIIERPTDKSDPTIPQFSPQKSADPPKPKINILSQNETMNIVNENTKTLKCDNFIKEFNKNKFKKKQPEGRIYNEKTKKFEIIPELEEIEKQIRNLEEDKELEIKNFNAKSVHKDICEKMKRNPDRAKDILTEASVKKVDPRTALKDFNKKLVSELLNE